MDGCCLLSCNLLNTESYLFLWLPDLVKVRREKKKKKKKASSFQYWSLWPFGHSVTTSYFSFKNKKKVCQLRQNKLDSLFLWEMYYLSLANSYLKLADLSCVLKTWKSRPASSHHECGYMHENFLSKYLSLISLIPAPLEDINCPAIICYVCVCVYGHIYVRSWTTVSAESCS